MDEVTTYAKIRRIKNSNTPFRVETKREDELRRFPCQHNVSFSTKEAAERHAAQQGWVLVKRWYDAGNEKGTGSHTGREGDSGRAITGQAACLLPQFSGREA